MKLEKFKDKEELINEELCREELNEDFSFYEICFDSEEVYLIEEVKDFEYGWLDFEDRTFTFKELKGQPIQQTVLLFLVEGGETQIFTENPANHLEMFRFYREQYRKENELAVE